MTTNHRGRSGEADDAPAKNANQPEREAPVLTPSRLLLVAQEAFHKTCDEALAEYGYDSVRFADVRAGAGDVVEALKLALGITTAEQFRAMQETMRVIDEGFESAKRGSPFAGDELKPGDVVSIPNELLDAPVEDGTLGSLTGACEYCGWVSAECVCGKGGSDAS